MCRDNGRRDQFPIDRGIIPLSSMDIRWPDALLSCRMAQESVHKIAEIGYFDRLLQYRDRIECSRFHIQLFVAE